MQIIFKFYYLNKTWIYWLPEINKFENCCFKHIRNYRLWRYKIFLGRFERYEYWFLESSIVHVYFWWEWVYIHLFHRQVYTGCKSYQGTRLWLVTSGCSGRIAIIWKEKDTINAFINWRKAYSLCTEIYFSIKH